MQILQALKLELSVFIAGTLISASTVPVIKRTAPESARDVVLCCW